MGMLQLCKKINVQRTCSLSNAKSNTVQDISIQTYVDDLELYGHVKS